MEAAVQWVRVYWTKHSRGAPGAIRRGGLPEAFPLPDAPPPFVHEVRMYEGQDFAPEMSLTGGLPAEVELAEDDGLLSVRPIRRDGPEWTRNGLALAWRPEPVRLRPRQTLRWRINHRIVAEWGWYYRLDTLNVAYGPFSGEVFLRPPEHRVDERVLLP
ncbi:hypothetical protein [Actinomadura macrotermitis]|uniref:Uncharacterized protein n=1 Tax=Actinomadura macrotermitis TaxID=2585200 RepID=A0A7K0C5N6_9ACTN|nr:hypothetical protein [Actinomadura macrotermitis]MQY08422.1 hypothetical protein [Actinomadura macrotermitis]